MDIQQRTGMPLQACDRTLPALALDTLEYRRVTCFSGASRLLQGDVAGQCVGDNLVTALGNFGFTQLDLEGFDRRVERL